MARPRTGFTTRASCLLAAGLTAVLCGLALGEVDLVRAGVFAAAIPCVAALLVHRSQVRIANRRSVEPPWAAAGGAVTVHLVITNRSVLRTGTLMLEDQLPERLAGQARFALDPLGAHGSRTVSYRMPSLGRGRYRVGPLQMRLSDPFRMIDLHRSFTATSEFVVAPVVDALPAIEPPRSHDPGGGGGSHSVGTHGADDQSTREYRTGDDLRKIHWRSSARTGALMVRQEERPWRGQDTVLLDLRVGAHGSRRPQTDDERADPRLTNSLEWAVSAAASIGSHMLLSGHELRLLDNPTQASRWRVSDPVALTHHLAGARELRADDLAAFAAPVRASARESATVALLGRLDAVTLRMLADAHPRGGLTPAFALLLDVDTWVTGTPAAPDAVMHRGIPAVSAIDASAAVLRNAGWRVVVVRHGTSTAQAWQVLFADAALRTSARA